MGLVNNGVVLFPVSATVIGWVNVDRHHPVNMLSDQRGGIPTISGLNRGAVGVPALVVARLDPRSLQSLDWVVAEEATVPRLEAEHLAGRVVEGPGEAGCIVGTGLGTLLPVRDSGLGRERSSQYWDWQARQCNGNGTVLTISVSPLSVKMILSSAGHHRSAG